MQCPRNFEMCMGDLNLRENRKLARANDSARCELSPWIYRILLGYIKNYVRKARPLYDLLVGHSTAKKDKAVKKPRAKKTPFMGT